MTGGDVAPAIPIDPVMNFMDDATPSLDIEVPCPFDSTAQMEKEYHIKTNSNRQFIVHSDDKTEEAILATIDMENDSLEIDSDKENSTSFISQCSICNVSNIDTSKTIKRKQAPALKVEKDFYNINNEKQLRLIKLRDAIAQ
ncbi:uncharacterized protein LOC116844987 [Odontomachus brunneus]|uniref:uncharacterized protein LOC116844987 n=1 Tax=Odontomachus brunneus TaxID=486640 RepID=UPI0013F2145D|nr:uncharacterized protein LOC116844987 [Odontomachus brunneus]